MPPRRKRHFVDESWLEEARCSNSQTKQNQQKSPEPHRAVLVEDIIYTIIEYVAELPDNDRQRALWSCALVSKSWSEGALRRLHRSPELATTNIDFFARTVCSGRENSHTSAHIARLKNSVRRLNIKEADQKELKSTIGRVVDQVKDSLESYESPGVPVNMGILSSLSRCTNLKCLDLAADRNELNFLDILNATATLPKVETLKLPRNAFKCQKFRLQGEIDLRWPPALRNLQLSDFFYWDRQAWAMPVNGGWPSTLRSLSIVECTSYSPLAFTSTAAAPQIEHFEIGHCTNPAFRLSLHEIFSRFPNVQSLKIPVGEAFTYAIVGVLGDSGPTRLECCISNRWRRMN